MKRYIFILLLAALSINCFAFNYTLSKNEQKQILEEAENWIDGMPDGLNDRMSDAVQHAMHGFYSEIDYFRNAADTVGINKYPVTIKKINGGNNQDIGMHLYTASSTPGNSPLLIYFHGGGWSVGSLKTVDKFCRALAAKGNIKIVSVEYPLSPENPYPAAVNKCKEAVEFILTKNNEWKFDLNKVSLGGDGSGGNLSLVTFSHLSNKKAIKSIVLYYPLLQTSGSLDPASKREYGRGYGFDSRLWEAFVAAYKSPDYNYFDNLPPVLMISAGRDIIIQEEKDFALSGNNITMVEFDGALHGFITDGHQMTAFKKAVEITDLFLIK